MSAPVTQREEAPQPGQAAQRSTLDTEYGGVFFLLNLALYLNIYADFTSPEGENLELSIWDFLALLGSEFTHGEIEADPLWKLLATLACRTDSQRPGEFFHPPSDWRLPSEWLRPFPEDYDQQPVLRNGRLISIHTAGFPVLDVACDHIQEDEPIDPLQRWLGWMAAYIRARLARALGREDAATMLCRLPARVACTLTHLDVTFSLDHHPIEVRLPGLDRDPGWIPASGRYVAFHFD